MTGYTCQPSSEQFPRALDDNRCLASRWVAQEEPGPFEESTTDFGGMKSPDNKTKNTNTINR